MLGDTIAILRKEKRLSGEKLARKVGISHGYICQIETGSKKPSVKLLNDIAPHLGVTLAELLFLSTCRRREKKIFDLVKNMFEAMMKPLIEEIDN